VEAGRLLRRPLHFDSVAPRFPVTGRSRGKLKDAFPPQSPVRLLKLVERRLAQVSLKRAAAEFLLLFRSFHCVDFV